eukprot:TRINITY_DN43556_c0_g1_i5.p1 TRINITY_DN43556_c0_g1~~TRINITY_DN43556_c0_g1_i5.p1  ORF type:complete len:553 (-),score=37.19 TRINITY_DN43556_c0_g1_i5:296-1954(-)
MKTLLNKQVCRQDQPFRQHDTFQIPTSLSKSQPFGYQKVSFKINQKQKVRRNTQVRNAALASSSTLESIRQVGELAPTGQHLDQINIVYKFGGSSLATASHMKRVAEITCSFNEYLPCVVLSAMGKTTNKLIEAGHMAIREDTNKIPNLKPLRDIIELHIDTASELQIDIATAQEVERLLTQLEQLLVGLSITKDLSPKVRDKLVSFGECLSTRIFASYLRSKGVPAIQHDAFNIGFATTDEFTNAEVLYDQAFSDLRDSLTFHSTDSNGVKPIPIVTGFLGRGQFTGDVTTLGRGGSDLTATVLGAALGVPEVYVWKDVDGVLTGDPRIVSNAQPVKILTFEEATELAYFGAQVLHPQAMIPAQMKKDFGVRVKNSYNRLAEGTLIVNQRDMSKSFLTSIVLKRDVTVVDICSTRMLGQYGFLGTVFDIFKQQEISVDVVATSEVSVSITLDPAKIHSRGLRDDELTNLRKAFDNIANVSLKQGQAIISLICNVQRSCELLERVFRVLGKRGITVTMISQGASKTNISIIVDDHQAEEAVSYLHKEFFSST